MGSTILEFVRRYSGNLDTNQVTILRSILANDIGAVPPGVTPVPQPVHPPGLDLSVIFNDGIDILPVAPANISGVENYAARVDHRHRGVSSIAQEGDLPIYGDVLVSVTGPLTLSRQGQRLQFGADVSQLLSLRVVERYELLAASPMTFQLLYQPIGEVAVYFDRMRLHRNLHYTQTNRVISLSDDVTLINNDLLLFDYFYTLTFESDAAAPTGMDFSVPDNSGLWALV